uniref:Uncharacterized protein n=1 Tax=Meloidogyne incognita TaxID=6306 RepID=A0A914N956_MELIC
MERENCWGLEENRQKSTKRPTISPFIKESSATSRPTLTNKTSVLSNWRGFKRLWKASNELERAQLIVQNVNMNPNSTWSARLNKYTIGEHTPPKEHTSSKGTHPSEGNIPLQREHTPPKGTYPSEGNIPLRREHTPPKEHTSSKGTHPSEGNIPLQREHTPPKGTYPSEGNIPLRREHTPPKEHTSSKGTHPSEGNIPLRREHTPP